MRIASLDTFGAVTWEFSPEATRQWQEAIARLKETAGNEIADGVERELIENCQRFLGFVANGMIGAVNMPSVAMLLCECMNEGLAAAAQEALRVLVQMRENEQNQG